MKLLLGVSALFLLPQAVRAQLVPVLYPHSGIHVTASPQRFEFDKWQFFHPTIAAWALPITAPPALASPLRYVKPAYHHDVNKSAIRDSYDMIFFGPTKPLHLRMILRRDGLPLHQSWLAILQRYFDFLDRDKDQFLNRFESENLISSVGMQNLLKNGLGFPLYSFSELSPFEIDFDQDGRISFAEFVRYYQNVEPKLTGIQPSTLAQIDLSNHTNLIMGLLDRNGDKKLSKDEVDLLSSRVAAFDADEDECLSVQELFSFMTNITQRNSAPLPKVSEQPFIIYESQQSSSVGTELLLKYYDSDKNYYLDTAEFKIDRKIFEQLDKNDDGQLSIEELSQWRNLPPDLSVEFSLNTHSATLSTKILTPPEELKRKGEITIEQFETTTTKVHFDHTDIVLFCPLVNPKLNLNAGLSQSIFDSADSEKKGYLTEKDIARPQFQILRIIFSVGDVNGDGKLDQMEYKTYVEIMNAFFHQSIKLSSGSQKLNNIFRLLDENNDNKLSQREMRNGWSRLKKVGLRNNLFDPKSIQPTYYVECVPQNESVSRINPFTMNLEQKGPKNLTGPIWFHNLDRNFDNDLSPAEFPGTAEEFAAIDLDHDGLISVAEAILADKKFRKAKQ